MAVLSHEKQLLADLCRVVATPIAYKASLAARDGDWRKLVSMKVDPTTYSSAEWYLRDAQIIALLKKHPGLPGMGAKERRQAAINKFLEAEAQCYKTNGRLRPLLSDAYAYGEALGNFIVAWRKEVRRVLRRAPSKESIQGRFGPGATFANKGDLITVADKLDEHYTATYHCLRDWSQTWDQTAWSRYAAAGLASPFDDEVEVVENIRGSYSVWRDRSYEVRDFTPVKGNRFTTVPKTALTDRGICIEPSLNVYYQLGVGKHITRQLFRSYLWDKASCQDYHRILAQYASVTGSLATIDLSSASDTVSRDLVKLLVPVEWWDLLVSLRCSHTFLEGKAYRLEKFSSMGNGFTFELETLIFYSLCRTIRKLRFPGLQDSLAYYKGKAREGHLYVLNQVERESTISVFGDDIIVPTWMADDVISALKFFGFSVNPEKTFLEGPFRESCGGDYFLGQDVRPHFQDVELDSPARLIACHNGLKRYSDRLESCCTHVDHHSYLQKVREWIPVDIRRCRGPAILGDLVLTDEDPRHWATVVRGSIRYIRVWRPIANREISWDHFRRGTVQAVALYRAGTGVITTSIDQLNEDAFRVSGFVPRIQGSYVSGYRFGRIKFS